MLHLEKPPSTWGHLTEFGYWTHAASWSKFNIHFPRLSPNWAGAQLPWHLCWINVVPLYSWFGATASWPIRHLRTLLWTTSSTQVSSTVVWRARSAERCRGRSCQSWDCHTGPDPTCTENTTQPPCLCWTCTTPCPQRTDTRIPTNPCSLPRGHR